MLRVLRALGVVLALAVASLEAAAAERELEIGGVQAVVWLPDDAPGKPWPLVVFSHGIRLCATQSRFLAEALVAAGYVVVAPNHADASCGAMELSLPDPNRLAMKPAALWTDADYRDRAEDVRKLLAAIPAEPSLRDSVDVSRLALAGHSLGGYTVLGLSGAWPKWKLTGVRAVLALSPYSLPFRRSDGLRKLGVPVMYQGGTGDLVFTPPLRRAGGAFDVSPSPKYYVEIDGAAHFAWTDDAAEGKETITAYAVAFLDRYVKGTPESAFLKAKQPGASAFRRELPSR